MSQIPSSPPPPPPPPMAFNAKLGGTILPPKMDDRSRLLSEIQTGCRLRKTITNDRSSPMILGRVNSIDTQESGDRNGFSAAKLSSVVVGGPGGIFANGIPKKPSDNKKNNNGLRGNTSTNISPPPASKLVKAGLPALPKVSPAQAEIKPIMSGCSESMHLNSVAKPEDVGIVRQTASGSTVADRLEQFNQVTRPILAPPTPPSFKAKPTFPSSPSKKLSPPEQFKTLRPNRVSSDTPSLRKSGSSDDVRNTSVLPHKQITAPPLLMNPPRIAKPSCPPPPPPSQPSRVLTRISPIQTFNNTANAPTFMPVGSQITTIDEDSPPPPPPPRIASCGDQMDRFTFIPIADLPLPEIFSGTKKVYEYHVSRRGQPSASAPSYR